VGEVGFHEGFELRDAVLRFRMGQSLRRHVVTTKNIISFWLSCVVLCCVVLCCVDTYYMEYFIWLMR
jgi:hypothetical protein